MFDIPGNPWITGGRKPLGKPLCVRGDIRGVWALASDAKLESVIITGTPGIGKTVGLFNWALICLAKAGHEHPIVLDLLKREERYVLWPDGRVQRHNEQAGRWLSDELNRLSTIVFTDPREENAKATTVLSAKQILVSSPDINNYQALLKDVYPEDSPSSARLYVYPWTRDEITLLCPSAGRDVAVSLQAFDVCGGSLRLILQGPAAALRDLMDGMDPTDIKGMADVYKKFSDQLGSKRSKLRHRVFHGFAPAAATERYKAVRPDFCSAFAREQFAKVLAEAKEAKVQELLEVLSPTQSLRGTIFESLLIQRFAHKQHLETFVTMRDETLAGSLQEQKTKRFILAVDAPEVRRGLADPLPEIKLALQEQKSRLLVPLAENYAAVDCFLVCRFQEKWRVIALQMTVAASHSYLPDKLAAYRGAAGKSPFVYCVVCLAKHRENMALSMADGALKQNKDNRKAVEAEGIWLIPFA